MLGTSQTSQRTGRTPTTTHQDLSQIAVSLFIERGFERTTIADIATAAGISRRTFFRYFPSKNDLPWGDFDGLLDEMRTYLTGLDPDRPLIDVLRQTVLDFNRYPDDELSYHRSRMNLLLHVPALRAHATLRYAAWRRVIAEYVAARRGERVGDLVPQAIAWACLGLCLSAYEQWLIHADADLAELLETSFAATASVFSASD